MAHALQIVTDTGTCVLSLNHLMPPLDYAVVGLLQAFYITGKENGGFQPRCLQTQNGTIVFADYSFGNNTYIFVMITNRSPANSDLGHANMQETLRFLQVMMLDLTGSALWAAEDTVQLEQLKKELKVSPPLYLYNG